MGLIILRKENKQPIVDFISMFALLMEKIKEYSRKANKKRLQSKMEENRRMSDKDMQENSRVLKGSINKDVQDI